MSGQRGEGRGNSQRVFLVLSDDFFTTALFSHCSCRPSSSVSVSYRLPQTDPKMASVYTPFLSFFEIVTMTNFTFCKLPAPQSTPPQTSTFVTYELFTLNTFVLFAFEIWFAVVL